MKEQEIRPKNLFEKYLELSEKDTKSFDKTQLISTNCVVCNSKNTNPFIKKNDFNYDLCNNCGSLFCNPRPSSIQLSSFYLNSNSANYWFEVFLPNVEETRREKIFKKKALQLMTFINSKNISISSLCDVGAGSGIFLEELKKINESVSYYAIEPGEVSSNILKDKGFNVLQESVENSTKWTNKFDFVTSLEVFEHVNDPLVFVKSINRLLKDDGYCLVTTLQYEGFDILNLGEKSNSISPPHHLNFASIEGLEILFKKAGFSEVFISTPGVLDVDIFINADSGSEFSRVIKKRGKKFINELQDLLIKHKMSSHVWILAKK
tara:strand:- start:128 stop:1090 length:963 start_codon:yes stop_codon:yes gene_type:complete